MKRVQILRVENDAGKGPFMASEDLAPDQREEYFFGFPAAVGWLQATVKTQDTDLLAALFGVERRLWLPTPDHPHHMDDVKPPEVDDPHRWLVGARDENQLEYWFPPKSFAFLAEWGFKRAVYEVALPYVHYGTYQLLFCLDDAKLLRHESL